MRQPPALVILVSISTIDIRVTPSIFNWHCCGLDSTGPEPGPPSKLETCRRVQEDARSGEIGSGNISSRDQLSSKLIFKIQRHKTSRHKWNLWEPNTCSQRNTPPASSRSSADTRIPSRAPLTKAKSPTPQRLLCSCRVHCRRPSAPSGPRQLRR